MTRPAKFFGTHYNEASKDVYQGINQILTGTPRSQRAAADAAKLQLLRSRPHGLNETREDGACHPPSLIREPVATPAPAPRRRRRRRTKLQRRQTRLAWLLLVPALAVVRFVAIYPARQDGLPELHEPGVPRRPGADEVGRARQLPHPHPRPAFRNAVVVTVKFTSITVVDRVPARADHRAGRELELQGPRRDARGHARAVGNPDGRRRDRCGSGCSTTSSAS